MKKIAIIGCGISGLYFANKLLSKRIYDFTIYEKKSEIDLNDGYGIQLSVNSIKLLNEIGFNNITANEIFFPKRVNFFDAKTCKKICEIDISKFNSENKRYTTLKRSILIKFLLNNIPAGKIKSNLENFFLRLLRLLLQSFINFKFAFNFIEYLNGFYPDSFS